MAKVMDFKTDFWHVFYDDTAANGALDNARGVGKWMLFFRGGESDWMEKVCRRAVESGACHEAKMSTPFQREQHGGTGVACFYIDGDSPEQHRRLLSHMLEEDLLERDGDGRLVDVDFKFDWQTAAGMYDGDSGYVPQIMLSDFVDLDTGEFL